MREPHDVFVREFLQHPAWSEVLSKLDNLAKDITSSVMMGTKDDFDKNRGRVEGVYEAMALIRGLIKQANKG